MQKAKVTYHAPDGDSKVVEMSGVTFFDGKEVELNTDENKALIDKLSNNQYFDFELSEDDGSKKRRGRPPKSQDLKAGISAAADHDFEKDRRDGISNRPVPSPEKLPATEKPKDEPAKSADQPKGAGEPNKLGGTGTSPIPAGSGDVQDKDKLGGPVSDKPTGGSILPSQSALPGVGATGPTADSKPSDVKPADTKPTVSTVPPTSPTSPVPPPVSPSAEPLKAG